MCTVKINSERGVGDLFDLSGKCGLGCTVSAGLSSVEGGGCVCVMCGQLVGCRLEFQGDCFRGLRENFRRTPQSRLMC